MLLGSVTGGKGVAGILALTSGNFPDTAAIRGNMVILLLHASATIYFVCAVAMALSTVNASVVNINISHYRKMEYFRFEMFHVKQSSKKNFWVLFTYPKIIYGRKVNTCLRPCEDTPRRSAMVTCVPCRREPHPDNHCEGILLP